MSGGKWMRGLPQHVLNMQMILEYVQQDREISAYPLFLYGHSWGGYAADTVSCLGQYPVRGLISVAAYNDALAVVRHISKRRYGRFAPLVILIFKLYQIIFLGRMSLMTSAQGLQKLSCPMLICHSLDDAVVSFHENFSNIRAALSERNNAVFWEMDGRNHNLMTPRDIDMRQRTLAHQLSQRYVQAKEQELWQLQLVIDEELLEKFAAFYKECI